MTREEAVEVYHGLINEKIKEAFEFFAPELRESEDERIRKEIIEKISNLACGCFISQEQKQKFISYLEKQKEQKPVEYLPKQKVFDIADKLTNLTYSKLLPIESDEYKKLYEIISDVYGLLDHPIEQMPVEEQKEQKPAEWEKATIDHLYTLASFIKSSGYEDDGEFLEGVANKLKTTQDHPATEWGYEDEKTINSLISLIEEIKSQPLKRLEDWDGYIHFLKSLRHQWKPSEVCYGAKGDPDPAGVWKPSEEQMYILNWVANILLNHDGIVEEEVSKKFQSLYNDLKKLM